MPTSPLFARLAHAESGRSVIFTETTTHGSLPWTAEHNRRALLCTHSTRLGHLLPAHSPPIGGPLAT